ncbi:MAG: FliI/YscN family ATPase [Brucellaceae bacterium]|nr:FliI/YscN family ATPase [Brucellaceae bacterium]
MPFARLREIEAAFRAQTAPGELVRIGGTIASIAPGVCRVRGLSGAVKLGDVVSFRGHGGHQRGEVIALNDSEVTVAPYSHALQLSLGGAVFAEAPRTPSAHGDYLGRVVNAFGEPLDDRGPVALRELDDTVPAAQTEIVTSYARDLIGTPFRTGVYAIDIFTPLCFGQRFGIFAGSGVGKSTLLGMLAKTESFDAVVVALVGERSREVREFIEHSIGPQALAKTAIVVSTGNESAMVQRRAPEFAMQLSERLRSEGKRVLLLLDSITRYAHAMRQVATLLGEPPVARGYPASVFSDMAKLLERAGAGRGGQGSITAIITVLVDGDDHNEPVADSVRGTVDGHLVLDRAIADAGRYPAINVLGSVSRLAQKAWSADQNKLVLKLRSMIARFEETKDLRLLGAWKKGSDPELDRAVDIVPLIYDALCQTPEESGTGDPFARIAQELRKAEPTQREPTAPVEG